mgnify:CR=1 FL=1|tara:strand:- start:72 stop:872 length:801 start_codon:yes stop_codon:yes gene_type:complete
MTAKETIKVATIEGPEGPREDGKVGRISFRVRSAAGQTYFVSATKDNPPKMVVPLEVDKTYTADTNVSSNKLNYINSAEETNAQPTPATSPAAASQKFGGETQGTRTRSIICQSIIKACAAPNGSIDQANEWLQWHDARVAGESMRVAGAAIREELGGADFTGFNYGDAKASVDSHTFNFTIDPSLWKFNRPEVVELIEKQVEKIEDVEKNPFETADGLANWWTQQKEALDQLTDSEYESFQNRMRAVKESMNAPQETKETKRGGL